ncbi:LOW QUALITY PROTEIN: hypothetical protein Cgig2_010185 [Carnegiea gigantea]|uniref:Uncharacterized protein n=1 Tax=Carnegiea gigantea TaxID=171969 RepID=A0A9Q1KAA9_9CARY|nr:LOW QUALITY PROTEIN: hypothetical protein Cgig2_010185 [Carnegiea gigantea]
MTLVHVVEVSLEIAALLKLWGQRHKDFAVSVRPVRNLAPSPGPPFLPPRPHQPQPSQAPPLASVANSFCRLHGSAFSFSQCRCYRVISPSNLRGFAAALTPRANASAMATSSLVTFGGSEALGVIKGELPAVWEATPTVLEGVTIRLLLPLPEKGWMPRSPLDDPQFVAACKPVSLWRASSRAERGGACRKNNLAKFKDHEKEGRTGYKLYLLGLLGDDALLLLFSPMLGVSCHLLCSSVPESKGRPRRERDRSQKNFNLGSQFKSSLLLDLLSPSCGSSFIMASASGVMKVYPIGRRYCFSRADLFNGVGVPGNSGPSATISATNPSGARPFLLSTDLHGANDLSGDEALVDAPSEDKLLDELSEEELEEVPPRLGLRHSLNLKISHIISYGDLPGICHLHLWAEDTKGGGILAARPQGSAQFKKRNHVGNLFGFLTFILLGDAGHHPTIDKGREARKLQVPTLHLGAGQPFRNASPV